jgi:1-acyl-sn-glycerol-3-phosphate acyltransferase
MSDIAAFPAAGRPVALRVRLLARLLRGFYFARIRLIGKPGTSDTARLVLSSHRNGALDGYVAMKAFPRTQGLVSIQLLQHPILHWLFDGLAVIREKDRAKYGTQRTAFASPVDAGCAQLRAGGDLLIFPEGSSEWGFQPLPYQRGAARIVRCMLGEQVPLQVIPLGLHYHAPDRFRSRVDLLLGEPVSLPVRQGDETDRAWEMRIHQAITAALDAVSVNCPDQADFDRACRHAAAMEDQGYRYAQAFIEAQQHLRAGEGLPQTSTTTRRRHWPSDCLWVAAFMLLAAPVLLVSRYAGSTADARNTVSFVRVVAGAVTALVWLPCLLLATVLWPWSLLPLWPLAALGWWRWPCLMHGGNR